MKMYMYQGSFNSAETGTNKGSAIYSSGSATLTLVFDYTVQTEHNTNDLDYAGNNALKLNGGTIKDIVAIDANLITDSK